MNKNIINKIRIARLPGILILFFVIPISAQVISGGGAHSLSICNDNTAMAWGLNVSGQLGNGDTLNRNIPVQVNGITGIIAISGGNAHTLALKNDGTVWAWGANNKGQLGNGTQTFHNNIPTQIIGLSGIIAISAGLNHSIALKNDGTVWAWGKNYNGQLGIGSLQDTLYPAKVHLLTNIIAIGAGQEFSIALKNDGTVWAWGYDDYCQIGGGGGGNFIEPLLDTSLQNIVSISCGWRHYFAIKNDGTVWGKGDNTSGQMGLGSVFYCSSPPTQNNTLFGIKSIACGAVNTIALKADSTVLAWGYGGSGVLGDGTTIFLNPNPVPVVGLTSIVSIACGSGHSLALKSDGTLWSWGGNGYGQLGNGTWSTAGCMCDSVPVQVNNLCILLGVEEINNEVEEINIYPNPCTSQLGIRIDELGIKGIRILNILGEVVISDWSLVNSKSAGIDVGNLAKGLYFVEVKTEKGIKRKKFVKE